MKDFTFEHDGFTFIRINKKKARAAFMNGLTVRVVPCKLRPFNKLYIGESFNRKNRSHFCVDEIGVKNDFANLVGNIEYYYCNSKTGNYCAFYVPVVIKDGFAEYDYSFLDS